MLDKEAILKLQDKGFCCDKNGLYHKTVYNNHFAFLDPPSYRIVLTSEKGYFFIGEMSRGLPTRAFLDFLSPYAFDAHIPAGTYPVSVYDGEVEDYLEIDGKFVNIRKGQSYAHLPNFIKDDITFDPDDMWGYEGCGIIPIELLAPEYAGDTENLTVYDNHDIFIKSRRAVITIKDYKLTIEFDNDKISAKEGDSLSKVIKSLVASPDCIYSKLHWEDCTDDD